jgi:hypothetical protein
MGNVVTHYNNYLTKTTLYTGFPIAYDLYQLQKGKTAQREQNKNFYWIIKAFLIGQGRA